ncbi:glycosyl hydrolase family 65 protein [Paenarthrobacter sp. Z7-10]|uniref:glycosyl hydrolase family 65 protein n=1 Tax=Paenarthrobacter sp. Z7-10 TaxID=2787635 RepID=UPI003FA7A55D
MVLCGFTRCSPPELPGVHFQLLYRGQRISVECSAQRVRLELHPGPAAAIDVNVEGIRQTLHAGQRLDVGLVSGHRHVSGP